MIIKIILKRQCKRIWKILQSVFAMIGFLVGVGEAADEIFDYQGLFQFYKEYTIPIILIITVISIKLNWDHLCYTVRILGSPDVSITLKMCDALKNDGSVIIPTNSTFDTIMEDDFISKNSIQGQYQIKFFKKNITDLNSFLEKGLEGKKSIELKDGRTTNTKRYPIGTVSRVSGVGVKKRAYFLADSDINKNGIPENVDISDLTKALVNLWNSLSVVGNKEDYSIPLLGTGRAGVKNASRDEVVKSIVISFLASTREHKITENLIICVHPLDFEKVHWDELCEYIRYQCIFANVNNDARSFGSQEITTGKATLASVEKQIDYDFGDEDEESNGNWRNASIEEKNKNTDDRVLEALSGNELNVSEIASYMGTSMSYTRRTLSRLVSDGKVKVVGAARNKKYTAIADLENKKET